jgi:predicted nucleic acid-binding Zn ribbon protein
MIRADRVMPAVLAEVIRKAPLCDEKVDFAWRSAVGSAIDRATKVRLDRHGVLHITAVDPQWTREVRRSSRLIMSRLAALLGDGVVKKIACDR